MTKGTTTSIRNDSEDHSLSFIEDSEVVDSFFRDQLLPVKEQEVKKCVIEDIQMILYTVSIPIKIRMVQTIVLPVVLYRCEWTTKKINRLSNKSKMDHTDIFIPCLKH